MDNKNGIELINSQRFKSLIHIFRGNYVMLDADLAAIYGYSTKNFNRQVKNNIERFDDSDLMFQLSAEEMLNLFNCEEFALKEEFLRCKNSTSSSNEKKTIHKTDNWGGRRYLPYAFTEQGVYMLMTVLKGPLAVKQSKILVKLFKQMKDYIIQNQPLLGQREYLQLSIQTSDNVRDIMELRSSLSKLDDKVAKVVDEMGQVVTQSQLSEVLLDFGEPAVRRGWLILNGQPVESDFAYKQIYAMAKSSIIMIDDYINLKTLSLMRDVAEGVKIIILSSNTYGYLKKYEVEDFRREFPNINLSILSNGGIFHDRYIIVDYGTENEHLYHCGASSKDGGNKVMSITMVEDTDIYHPLIDQALLNPTLEL